MKWAGLLVGLLVSLGFCGTTNAALISRLGGQAYYDNVLDITWLADANLADTNAFGVVGINANGSMNWDEANAWIAGMNGANYLGFGDWRLPTVSPVSGGAEFNTDFSNNGTTDYGSGEPGVGWRTLAGDIVSEMGWMHYGNLGNLGYCTPNDAAPDRCDTETDYVLVNSGPFGNIQWNYWSGVELSGGTAWYFGPRFGGQDWVFKESKMFVWAVRSGDVAPVPLPSTVLLLGAALIGLAGARKDYGG